MATEVGQLTVKVDTSQVKRATDDLEDMAGAAGQAEAAVGGVGTASSKAQPPLKRLPPAANDSSRGFGAMGRNAGMAAIQIEQLSGQIAAGQNPMRAFGVQAADLGFVLGVPLLGAAIGVGAAIASMIPSMLNADKSAEDLADSMEEIGKMMSVNAKTGADELSASFVRLAERSRELAELQLRVSLVEAMNNATAAAAIMADSLDDLRVKQQQHGQMSRGNARALREFSEEMGISQENALELRTAIDSLRAGNEGAADSFIDLLGSLARSDEVTDKFLTLAGPVLTAALNMKTAEEQAAFLKATLGDLDGALKTATESSSGFAGSQERAASALQEMMRLNDDANQRSLNREKDRIAAMQELRDQDLISEEEFQAAITEIKRAGVEERQAIDLEAFNKLDDERQQRLEHEKEQAALARANEIAAEQEKANALNAIEDVFLKNTSEKKKSAFRLAVGLMDAEKRERAKEIISKSYNAAMGAYESLAPIPVIGPALGAAAAAAIMVQGAQMAAQSLAGRALGGQVRPGESYVVGERGPEILTMGNSRGSITPNEAMGGSTQTVNKTANVSFNIQANDTQGFDELLVQRRGLIISVINEALNDQGRPSLA